MPDVSVPNYGLLSGLAEGVKQGLLTYQNTKNIQHNQQMEELMTGYQKDENGNLTPTPGKQLELQAKQTQNQGLIDASNPQSQYSSGMAQRRGVLAHAGNPNIPENAFEGTSDVQQKELENLSKPDISGYMGMQKQLMNPMAQVRQAQLEETKSQNAAHAGESFDKDPVMKTITGTKNNLDRAINLINGKTPITSSKFKILQQDMINATAPGGAATEGKVSREGIDLLAEKLNRLETQFGSVQDLRKEAPDIFNDLRDTITAVRGDYAQAANQRVKELGSNFQDSTNQKVQSTVKRKMGMLQDKYGSDIQAGAAVQSPQFTPDVVAYAQKHGLTNDQAMAIKQQRTGGK